MAAYVYNSSDCPVSQRPPAQWSVAQSTYDAWAAPTVGREHRTVRCAPDCPVRHLAWRCNGRLRQNRKEIGTGPSTVTVRWRTDCLMCHPTEGKDSLPCWPPTAPSYLGAIKGTPRRMESPKHSRNILRLLDSNFAHLILCVSDLSSI